MAEMNASPSPAVAPMGPSPSGSFAPRESIVLPMLVTLAQTGCIILLGYLSVSVKLVGHLELRGIYKFCGKIALPAIFFSEVANIEWSSIHVSILLGMFAAKVLTFIIVAIYVVMRQRWQPPSKGTSVAPGLLSTMGLFCIFTTKSNDIALGVPLLNAVFGPNTFSTYLYLFAPLQLLVLNVAGFLLLEIDRSRKGEGAMGAMPTTSFNKHSNKPPVNSQMPLLQTERKSSDTVRNRPASFCSPEDGRNDGSTTATGSPFTDRGGLSPEALSTCALLPRVFWNVITTPPVISVIAGLIVNIILTFTLTPEIKASRETLIPSEIQGGLSIISDGYAVTALFSIGAGMHGCLARAHFSRSNIFDGVVLIFFKVLFMAYATNRMVAIFLEFDSSTPEQFKSDASDFAWLCGMIPVAPTIYMFAELYGVHQDFMALFSNVCMAVAAPFLVMGVVTLDITRGMDKDGIMHLHGVLSKFLAIFGLCGTIPVALGFVLRRYYRWLPCDYILVMIVAYIGYSTQTLVCITSGDSSASILPALISFFFETLYQSHMAALSIFLGLKQVFKSRQHRQRFRLLTHVGSLTFSGTAAAIVYAIKSHDQSIQGVAHCAIEMSHFGTFCRSAVGGVQTLCLLAGLYGLFKFYRHRIIRQYILEPRVTMSSPIIESGFNSRDRLERSASVERSVSTYGLYPPVRLSQSCDNSSAAEGTPNWKHKETPVRVVVLICTAMLGCLCRSVTTFTFDFDIPSTIEISLLASVVTYSQGIVLFSLYALHPRVLRYIIDLTNRVILCWHSSSEATRLASTGVLDDAEFSSTSPKFSLECNTDYENSFQKLNLVAVEGIEGASGLEEMQSPIRTWNSVNPANMMLINALTSLNADERESWVHRNRERLLALRTRSTVGPY